MAQLAVQCTQPCSRTPLARCSPLYMVRGRTTCVRRALPPPTLTACSAAWGADNTRDGGITNTTTQGMVTAVCTPFSHTFFEPNTFVYAQYELDRCGAHAARAHCPVGSAQSRCGVRADMYVQRAMCRKACIGNARAACVGEPPLLNEVCVPVHARVYAKCLCCVRSACRVYSDIYGVQIYVSNAMANWTLGTLNMTIYQSPTRVFNNGTVCASGFSPSSFGAAGNAINCTASISNARYVTVVRPGTNNTNCFMHMMELLILRSGAALRADGKGHAHVVQPRPSPHEQCIACIQNARSSCLLAAMQAGFAKAPCMHARMHASWTAGHRPPLCSATAPPC